MTKKNSASYPHSVSITVSTTSDQNLSPPIPLSFSARVLLPCTEASGLAGAMIEAISAKGLSKIKLALTCYTSWTLMLEGCQWN